MSEPRVTFVERFLWMIWAPFEFAATVLIGIPLYLVWVVLIYLKGLRGLFTRGAALFVLRFRVGRVRDSLCARGAAAASGDGRPQFPHTPRPSWLN